ncbi:armadillo repeat-containing protein 5 [Hyperolius riggenbachi]|uniref:armadillo repeat-containing protein 5 n=1 Tax=Hyperolius riggenbachi TaxID=752182 RepID=UPI0035A28DEE
MTDRRDRTNRIVEAGLYHMAQAQCGHRPSSADMSVPSIPSCLKQLAAVAEDPVGLGKELSDLRSRRVSRTEFRKHGGLALLVSLLTKPSRAAALGSSRRNLELALSLLANSCTEAASRLEVRRLGGIPALVSILQTVCVDTIWNRVARALGNLALDPQNSSKIHELGAVSSLVHILQRSTDGGCVQSCLRALRILGDTVPHRLSICQQGGLAPCVQLLTSPEAEIVCTAVRSVCELSRGCSLDCAEQLSPAVPALVALASGEDVKATVRQAALGTLCNLCCQGALRPILGNAGIIKLLITEAIALQECPSRCLPLVRALCFCCREAVNRLRLRELGGLDLLLDLLRNPQYQCVHHRITAAFLHYCHDPTALSLLGLGGLAPLLAERLEESVTVAVQRGCVQNVQEAPDEEEVRGSASFDFPQESKTKREQGGTSEESLRSWLLAEGYISSLEDLPPEWIMDTEDRPQPIASSTSTVASPTSTVASPVGKVGNVTKQSEKQRRQSCPLPRGLSSTTSSQPYQSPMQEILASSSLLGPRCPPPAEILGPEFPAVVLLSCFSQLSDSASCLVSHTVLKGLLTYLIYHPQPSNRAARLLQRLTCDPSCLEAFIRTGSICTLRARLLLGEPRDAKGREGSRHPERARELGRIVLRNLRIQAESPFGVGLVTHMLVSGPQTDRQQCALCLPFIYRKDSPHRQHLLDGAIRLVLEPLMLSVDPNYFFHASECLSSILSPQTLPQTPQLTLSSSPSCPYTELFAQGTGDVAFVLDGGDMMQGSREVLSRSCDVFRAMLQGGYVEAQQHEVRVREVPPCAFLPLLHYLHGCSQESLCPTLQKLSHTVPGQELAQSPLAATLAAAGRFLLPDLQSALERTVRDTLLSLESLSAIYQLAEVLESSQLRRDCCMYLLRRPHPPKRRSHALLQLCEQAQDKERLSKHLEDAVQEQDFAV